MARPMLARPDMNATHLRLFPCLAAALFVLSACFSETEDARDPSTQVEVEEADDETRIAAHKIDPIEPDCRLECTKTANGERCVEVCRPRR